MVVIQIALLAALAYLDSSVVLSQTVTVSSTASHAIPTSLWGQMFEDINSGDGGLYAELLQNRAFQQVQPGSSASLTAWSSLNSAKLQVVADAQPVSSALPNSLTVTVPTSASGPVGFANSGYFGIKVDSTWTYQASLYYKFPASSNFTGSLTFGLRSSSGQILASSTANISGKQTSWARIAVSLKPKISAGNTNNLFTVTVDGTKAAGATIHFAMFSLFPPTFKNRPNGMRIDIAETLADMAPTFFRLPGGNNLEGQTIDTRWKWNETVGDLLHRPGRLGDWGYINTDGLGLLEYLNWCEDLGMEPIMAVYAGYSLNTASVPEVDLGPYIQEAIDQINFVIGDAKTSPQGALRASLGHPAPFKLQYVEIGNEDFFAADTYVYRWADFAATLEKTFPNLHFIATSNPFAPELTPTPKHYDNHVYQTPTWFSQNSFFYDEYERNGTTYFEGEYAVITTSNATNAPRIPFPTMEGSSAEAAFMIGFERNADIVFAASYAPLLQNVNSSQWSPDLVSFDAANVYPSTSYYVQKLFATHKGTEYLPSTLPSRTGTTFWSVVRDGTAGDVIVKIANTSPNPATFTFHLPFSAGKGTLEVITGSRTASNTPANPKAVVPKESSVAFSKGTFAYKAPGYSVSVAVFTV